jgi:hypothetical protein
MGSHETASPEADKWWKKFAAGEATLADFPEPVIHEWWRIYLAKARAASNSVELEKIVRAEVNRRSAAAYEQQTRRISVIAIVVASISTLLQLIALWRGC